MKVISFVFSLQFGILIFGSIASAQLRADVPKPSGKILEISFRAAVPPAQMELKSHEPSGAWTTNIDRIKGWKLPAGQRPIQAVNVESRLVGDRAEIKVSVFSGTRFGEFDDLIATLSLAVGQSTTVEQLAKYGFEPLKIRMVTVTPTIVNVPVVINSSPSVQVLVTPAISTLPAFGVKFTNGAPKDILALIWHTESDRKMLSSAMTHSQYGKSLMLPDETYDTSFKAARPDPMANGLTLYVDAVVFSDGSFEGNRHAASHFLSFVIGRKQALSKLIPILTASVQDQTKAIDPASLIEQVNATPVDLDRSVVDNLVIELSLEPSAKNSLTHGVRVALDGVKTDIVKTLERLRAASPGRSDADVRKALTNVVREYQAWLDRLPI
ncbi:MAG: hypothetical protein WBO10_01080 [Pyrinomonadaceae bacterium]